MSPPSSTGDFYALLGVSSKATEDEIKRAYRKLARELHPDAKPGDPVSEERFKEVTLAYEVLRDPERRRRYDMYGPDAVRGSGAAGAQGSDPFAGFGRGNGALLPGYDLLIQAVGGLMSVTGSPDGQPQKVGVG